MLRALVLFSWLAIAYVFITFFKSVSLVELEESIFAVTSYIGWSWLIIFTLLAMTLRGLRWVVFFSGASANNYYILFLHHGWFFILSMMSLLRSGEIIKVAWLKKNGMPASTSISYIFIEKLSDAFVLSAFLIFGVMMVSDVSQTMAAFIGVLIIATYLVVSIYGKEWHNFIQLVSSKVKNEFLRRVMGFVAQILLSATILKHVKYNIFLILITMVIWLTVAFGFHLFLIGQYYFMPFYASALIVAMVNLTGVLNLSPGNIGPFELCIVMVLAFYGVSEVEATVFAIALHMLVLATTIIYGIICRGFIVVSASRQGNI
jgi:hypothetical protein